MTRIVFRADGNNKIGLGHIMRCLALAEMLKGHFECVFATRYLDSKIKTEIDIVCSSIILLPEENDNHFDAFLNQLKGDEIVILDNYFYNTEYQKKIRNKGCSLVCIDDLGDKYYSADVVINHNPVISPNDFTCEPFTRLCLGLDYALLRQPFFNTTKLSPPKDLLHAIVCYGGADPENLTYKTTNELITNTDIKKISIIIGSSYRHNIKLNNLIQEHKNNCKIEINKNVNANQLVKLFYHADFAVVPCSTILLEVLSQNLPAISGYYTDNQKLMSSRLEGKYNDLLIIGNLKENTITTKEIDTLKNLLKNKKNSHAMDLCIPERITKVFKALELEKKIRIRQAQLEDINLYFEWANEKFTRQNSINSEPILFKNHKEWFINKLESRNTYLFLFEMGSHPIGQVRLDCNKEIATVNYSIDYNFRGKGFGLIMLKLSIQELLNLTTIELKKLQGIVKRDNAASIAIFKNLGFSVIKKDDIYITYSKTFRR